jgi:hypothetical protein
VSERQFASRDLFKIQNIDQADQALAVAMRNGDPLRDIGRRRRRARRAIQRSRRVVRSS